MKKEEFIAALAAEIRDLSKDDIARSLEYYGEMIDERVEDGMSVEDAVADLGGVEKVAQQIMEDLPRERRTLGESSGELGDRIRKEVNEWTDRLTKDAIDKAMGSRRTGTDGAPDDDDGNRDYSITEEFQSVNVQVGGTDVRVMRSNDGETHVVTEDMHEFVDVIDGVLVVRQEPSRQEKKVGSFFGINFNFSFSDSGSVTLYLADKLWESVLVQTLSGDVEAEDLRARGLSISSKSGDVEARHLTVEGKLEAKTTSGDVELSSATAGEVWLSCLSGDIEVDDTEAGSMCINTKSGDLDMENTVVHGKLTAETVSGDVTLRRSDARDLLLRTTSGDVDGTLLSPKAFSTHTVNGDVNVPQSVSDAGSCEAHTVNGDISLRIAP